MLALNDSVGDAESLAASLSILEAKFGSIFRATMAQRLSSIITSWSKSSKVWSFGLWRSHCEFDAATADHSDQLAEQRALKQTSEQTLRAGIASLSSENSRLKDESLKLETEIISLRKRCEMAEKSQGMAGWLSPDQVTSLRAQLKKESQVELNLRVTELQQTINILSTESQSMKREIDTLREENVARRNKL